MRENWSKMMSKLPYPDRFRIAPTVTVRGHPPPSPAAAEMAGSGHSMKKKTPEDFVSPEAITTSPSVVAAVGRSNVTVISDLCASNTTVVAQITIG